MKHIAYAAVMLLLLSNNFYLAAQKTSSGKVPYKVVFDITSKDTMAHKTVIRLLTEITNSNPEAQLEVVYYGKSLDMIVKDKSTQAAAVQKFAQNKNVSFRVCKVAMKNNDIDMSQLIPGVETIPDGVYEIISKQAEGWGYIKISN
jgi:intracellular sulfur oxidation DsrE/DsrF family protein